MTLKSLALTMVMAGALAPGTAFAQTTQTPIVPPQLATPKPQGHATDTTDRVGLTNRPTKTIKTPTPRHVPGWHIPLPHIHRGR